MFEPKQVGSDLDRVPVLKVKRLIGCFWGYLGVTIVLEDASLKFAAVSLGEVDHRLDWHLILNAADDNVVRELAEPLEIDLLVCGKIGQRCYVDTKTLDDFLCLFNGRLTLCILYGINTLNLVRVWILHNLIYLIIISNTKL